MRTKTVDSMLPTSHLPSDSKSAEPATQDIDWHVLVSRMIHPTKVATIEALSWIGQPLSASQLVAVFDREKDYLSLVSYHVRRLLEAGVLEIVEERQVRGTVEKLFFFRTEMENDGS